MKLTKEFALKLNDAATLLYLHDLLTDGERKRVHQKLMKKLEVAEGKHTRNLARERRKQ